ncbi:MAG: alanyl-tRNA synthetase [Thermoanaerobacter sp.]|uniref:alanine--tRNA ligase n=1 Tax=Desulfofundulus thermocisternus TaxID=42471 RepID=UPI0004869C23|nr:alanine--tRNA ligase [Desulfofundulus thermocisternus]MDK2889096.1 alanyl-tRNA synthetase [Thermoanaerobacter sp.]
MTGKEIREKFLKFFEARGHRILPSASLIPANDPSLLWTAAGMVPFKPYFTGAAKPEVRRVTTCQKCLRTPDIESVGRTARHHTFFEMLGNFSFGDYFKEKAIPWAWEFTTRVLGLPEEKLWISIYLDDDEAFDIWHREVGVPAERIVRMGKDTNFWEIGVGPCGPCSEIYVDLGEERGCGSATCGVGCDCDRFLEIWNLVFIQFFRDEAGNYTPLASKGIDTGMGLERVASVLQGVQSNFDTDLFREIMDFTASLAGVKYGVDGKTDMALKVIADHCRAVTFAISDGALPSNEGRGYVLRRLLRRAARFGRVLGLQEPFLYQVSRAVINQMADAYPELPANEEHVLKVIRSEEERFGETLAQGMEILNRLVEEARATGSTIIRGEDAFRLYDTYGFPLELTREMAAEEGLTVDEEAFTRAMEEQRERARRARQETEYLSEKDAFYQVLRDRVGESRFVGYDTLKTRARVTALLKEGQPVEKVVAGEEVEIILDVTPCYAEAGGQVSDHARISSTELEVEVREVYRPVEGLYVHRGRVLNGILQENASVVVEVDSERRWNTARNHSATHLLHKALKEILGHHVNQAGSLVEPDRLRFDFTHYAPVSPEELRRIEEMVNQVVLENLPVETLVTSLEEARAMGAVALFGEKYGERVRVVKMGDFSLELCGGTHVRSTAEIGFFKLISESSVGAGLRRVEGVTGIGALRYIRAQEEQLSRIAALVRATPSEVVHRVESLLKEMKELERESEGLRARLARFEVQSLLEQVKDLDGIKFLAAKTSAPDMDSLRAMVDLLRERLGSAVILLASPAGEKVNLVAAVTRDLLPRGLHAGKLVKEVASMLGGGGGGRPDMAQAGGKDPSRLQEALQKAYTLAAGQIKN